MARGDQLGRQWRVLQTLITSKRGKSAAELADELECHPRTVYRDLEALQIAGFPIYTDREDGKSLWSLLDTVKHQIPIPFTLTELMALYFSRDMLKVFKDTHFHDSLESLFKKVKATLPKKSLGYLDEVEQVLHVGLKPYKEYGKFREIINQVNEVVRMAAEGRKPLEVSDRPSLVIFGFDEDQRVGKVWTRHREKLFEMLGRERVLLRGNAGIHARDQWAPSRETCPPDGSLKAFPSLCQDYMSTKWKNIGMFPGYIEAIHVSMAQNALQIIDLRGGEGAVALRVAGESIAP